MRVYRVEEKYASAPVYYKRIQFLETPFMNSKFDSYSDQQKHESSCLLSDFLSCISPEPLELQKSCLHLFACSFEDFSDEIRIFEIR